MNFCEKLLRSAYGRHFYKMITGVEVPREMWCSINEVLVIDKGIVEPSMKDIEQIFFCYDYLQLGLHIGKSDRINRFTEELATPLKNVVADEELPFGKSFSEVVFRVIIAIAESDKMILSVSEIRDLALRPTSQFLQDEGAIGRSTREIKMKQVAFIAAFVLTVTGICTIVSTKNFSTQH